MQERLKHLKQLRARLSRKLGANSKLDLNTLLSELKTNGAKLLIKKQALKPLFWSTAIVFMSYTLASALSSLFVPLAMQAFGTITVNKHTSLSVPAVNFKDRPNFHDVRKNIIDRNLFNLEGSYPDEQDDDAEGGERKKSEFDATAPCVPTTLKLTLIGTIFLGDPSKSSAIIRETGIEDADIYRTGEAVIGNPQAQIYSIERNRVVINNAGLKECLELAVVDPNRALVTSELGGPAASTGAALAGSSETVQLQAAFVEKELGDGFSNILQSARLVPNTTFEGRVNGFKVFAIQKGSLFDQVGLQEGDVVTQVNQTMIEAESGFVLYQAFLDERFISIQVLRDGTTPYTLHVQIK